MRKNKQEYNDFVADFDDNQPQNLFYIQKHTDNEFGINMSRMVHNNMKAIKELVNNYHEQFYLYREEDFGFLNDLEDNIRLIDWIYFVLQRCEKYSDDEEKLLKLADKILDVSEVTSWEDVYFSIRPSEWKEAIPFVHNKVIESLNDYHNYLYQEGGNKKSPEKKLKYKNIVNLLENLSLEFIPTLLKYGSLNSNLLKEFILWYHRQNSFELSPGRNNLFNKLMKYDKDIRIVPVLNLISDNIAKSEYEPVLNQLDKKLKEKKYTNYRKYLKNNFSGGAKRKSINEDAAIIMKNELVDKYQEYTNIQEFLSSAKDIIENKKSNSTQFPTDGQMLFNDFGDEWTKETVTIKPDSNSKEENNEKVDEEILFPKNWPAKPMSTNNIQNLDYKINSDNERFHEVMNDPENSDPGLIPNLFDGKGITQISTDVIKEAATVDGGAIKIIITGTINTGVSQDGEGVEVNMNNNEINFSAEGTDRGIHFSRKYLVWSLEIGESFGMEIGNGTIVNTKFSIDPTGPNYTISVQNETVKQTLKFNIMPDDLEFESDPSPELIESMAEKLIYLLFGILGIITIKYAGSLGYTGAALFMFFVSNFKDMYDMEKVSNIHLR